MLFFTRGKTTRGTLNTCTCSCCVACLKSCSLFLCLSDMCISVPSHMCARNICEKQCCRIAFMLHCSLLRCLCNVITNHTWRASWHSHKVRMKYEDDYGDPRLYYHNFLIIASLIYFCLFYPFLSYSLVFSPLHPSPMTRAEVEQKGKSLGHISIHKY